MQRKPHLRLAITDACNLSCLYCRPGGEGKHADYIMNYDEIMMSLKCASKAGFRHLKITGGEPLLREKQQHDLFKIISQIKNEGLFEKLEMVTNGVFLKEYSSALASSGLDGLTVSLDVANKDMFFNLTKHNEYEKIIDGINEFKRYGIPINFNAVISSYNIHNVNDLISLSYDLGIDLKLIDYVNFEQEGFNLGSDIEYVCFDKIYGYLRTLQHQEYVLYPNGGLGTPMSVFELDNGVKIIVKDATVGTNYNDECKSCKYYPCQDALISIRITSDGYLKKCLLRDDNLLSIIDELQDKNYDKVMVKFKRLFDSLEESNYYPNLWNIRGAKNEN